MIKRFIGNNWIAILIFSVALLVRVIGVYPGYTSDHPDEPGTRALWKGLRFTK